MAESSESGNRYKEMRAKVAANMLHTPNLRELRSREGWDQITLAAKSKVSPNTIHRLEKGRPARPSSVDKIALALQTNRDALTKESTSSPKPLDNQ
jgi:transcriptional regulator with XRE-family HTH domain